MGSVPASPHAAPGHHRLKLKRQEHRSQGGTRASCSPHTPLCRMMETSRHSLRHRRELFPCNQGARQAVRPATASKWSQGRLKLDDTTKTRSEPGRAKQTRAPCVSSIPIPPSSRFSCRSFPTCSAPPLRPIKKGTEKDRQRTFRVRVTPQPSPSPSPSPPSRRTRPTIACSCPWPARVPSPSLHPLLLPPSHSILPVFLALIVRASNRRTKPSASRPGDPSARRKSRARARIYLPIVSVKLSYFIAAAGGPVAGLRALGTLVLPARRTSILGSTPRGGTAILRPRLHFYLPIAPEAALELPQRAGQSRVCASSAPSPFVLPWAARRTAPILGRTRRRVWHGVAIRCALVECLSMVGVRGAANSGRAVRTEVSEGRVDGSWGGEVELTLPLSHSHALLPFPNRLLPRAHSRDEDGHGRRPTDRREGYRYPRSSSRGRRDSRGDVNTRPVALVLPRSSFSPSSAHPRIHDVACGRDVEVLQIRRHVCLVLPHGRRGRVQGTGVTRRAITKRESAPASK
ncbi:hypothetical protein B0H13DRAFT_2677523 [Mycena leptocephala]|nr:hypothetical protein B0H13DRAFT_2677523 [Mycena leptocephala]